jgi:glycosyltransferase A (GT-A) superfamily protein (DUF2064 family)
MATVIAILTRSPSDPRLKMRIESAVPNPGQRRDLVLAFIDDLSAKVALVEHATLKIAVTAPVEGFRLARPWVPWHQLVTQRGATFGERLRHVVDDLVAAGHQHIVLLGADVPDLPVSYLSDAVEFLDKDPNVVVTGPSADGSFHLLGLTVLAGQVPDLFSTPKWGTASMLDDLEAAARQAGRTVVRTGEWQDIDTPDDLADLVDRLRDAPNTAPATADVLRTIGRIAR